MSKHYFAGDDESYKEEINNLPDQELARLFTEQVNAFYSIPRDRWKKKEIVFYPSGVTKCARELYYENLNFEPDDQEMIAWRERMSRNGTGCHDITQSDYRKMEERLKKAGIPVKFRFLDSEFSGERTFDVGGTTVKLKGRSDGLLGLLDDDGNVTKKIIWEKKTKDKKSNLNKLIKSGQPQYEHRQQGVAYAIIWNIQDIIYEYESLQKPDWGDVEPSKPDIAHFYVHIEKEEAKQLLFKLAKIVKMIENRELPDAELDRCGFCPFHNQCAKDGGFGCTK